MLALVVAFTPAAQASADTVPISTLPLLAATLREVLVGLVYAGAIAIPILGLGWGGRLTDRFAGLHASERGPLATLFALGALAVFTAVGGHRFALMNLGQSFVVLPVGVAHGVAGDPSHILEGGVRLFTLALTWAVVLTAPLAASALMLDLALAFATRWPSVLHRVEGTGLRAAFVILGAGLLLVVSARAETFRGWIATAARLVQP